MATTSNLQNPEESYNIHTTIVRGILCNRCKNELPPHTMAEHLAGSFNKDCPHTMDYCSKEYRDIVIKRIIATEYPHENYTPDDILNFQHYDELLNELHQKYRDNPLYCYADMNAYIEDMVAGGDILEYEDDISGKSWYYNL